MKMSDELLKQATDAHRNDKLDEAERLYRSILKTNPKQLNANHNLGLIVVSFGKVEEALSYLKIALMNDTKNEQFWLSYVQALISNKNNQEANALLLVCQKSKIQRGRV